MPRWAHVASSGRIVMSGNLRQNLIAAPAKLHVAIGQVMEYNANEAQNSMRTGARWTDRTGNARQGLFARSGRDSGQHFILLYHTVPYGIWLEVRWNGAYAIIEPTVLSQGQKVMADLSKLIKAVA